MPRKFGGGVSLRATCHRPCPAPPCGGRNSRSTSGKSACDPVPHANSGGYMALVQTRSCPPAAWSATRVHQAPCSGLTMAHDLFLADRRRTTGQCGVCLGSLERTEPRKNSFYLAAGAQTSPQPFRSPRGHRAVATRLAAAGNNSAHDRPVDGLGQHAGRPARLLAISKPTLHRVETI